MGIKIKSVLSVHNYSQRKKWEIFGMSVRIPCNLFLKRITARHPESTLTMRPSAM